MNALSITRRLRHQDMDIHILTLRLQLHTLLQHATRISTSKPLDQHLLQAMPGHMVQSRHPRMVPDTYLYCGQLPQAPLKGTTGSTQMKCS